jgi:hypothetical protein
MFLAVFQSSPGLQAAVARALDASTPAPAPTLRAAVMNLTRPLMVAPAIIMAHVSHIVTAAVLSGHQDVMLCCVMVSSSSHV